MCYLERLDEVVEKASSDLDRIEDTLHSRLMKMAKEQGSRKFRRKTSHLFAKDRRVNPVNPAHPVLTR